MALGALLVPAAALADEGGVGFWIPGQYASFAASQTDPGWSVGLNSFISKGTTPTGTFTAARGGTRVSGRTQVEDIFFVQPGYTFETPVFSGQLFLSATFGYSWINNQADSVIDRDVTRRVRRGKSIIDVTRDVQTDSNVNESGWGLDDISPMATLKWQFGSHNLMVYTTANVPTGYYDPTTLSTPGLGFWAIDGGLGYTYDGGKGLEFSITAGTTYNFQNPTTGYQSGVDGHIDWGASVALGEKLYLGAVGYFYNQLGPDSGPGARLGAFQSKVTAVGPQIGYAIDLGVVHADLNLRSYKEFDAQNRPEGWNLWLTLSLSKFRPRPPGQS